jgi:hypothetical protein
MLDGAGKSFGLPVDGRVCCLRGGENDLPRSAASVEEFRASRSTSTVLTAAARPTGLGNYRRLSISIAFPANRTMGGCIWTVGVAREVRNSFASAAERGCSVFLHTRRRRSRTSTGKPVVFIALTKLPIRAGAQSSVRKWLPKKIFELYFLSRFHPQLTNDSGLRNMGLD